MWPGSAESGDGYWLRIGKEYLVAADNARRLSFFNKLPMVNQEQASAEATHSGHIMRDHENRLSSISKLPDTLKTFFSESDVAHPQYFIDNQDIRIDLSCN
jgi:hypothetical protein